MPGHAAPGSWSGSSPEPTLRTDLAACGADEGIAPPPRAELGRDGAGWHTATRLGVPAGVPLVFRPPARRGQLVDDPVATRTLADLTALAAVRSDRCQVRAAERQTSRAHPHDPGGA